MGPSYATIITPLKPDMLDECRRYLRDNVQPCLDGEHLRCRPLFPFDEIVALHFCSFLILDAEDGFPPRLIFEATFDGSRELFFDELLNRASPGMRDIYRYCDGFSSSALAAPNLMKEYLLRHDVGADTYFSGSPGRTVEQIKGEHRIRSAIVGFLCRKRASPEGMPNRSNALLDMIKREVIRASGDHQWAAQPAPVPWEIQSRPMIVSIAAMAALALACAVGALFCLWLGLRPQSLLGTITGSLERATIFGGSISRLAVSQFPWTVGFVKVQPAILDNLLALSVLWYLVRTIQLVLSSFSADPRAQTFSLRFPLHLFIIFRYALTTFAVGAITLAVIAGMTASRTDLHPAFSFTTAALIFAEATVCAIALLTLNYWANSLRQAVEVRRLGKTRENIRRLLLDLTQFAMIIVAGLGALVIVRHLPLFIGEQIAAVARFLVYAAYVAVACAVIGILIGYTIALILFAIIRFREIRDNSDFADPAELASFATDNARKFLREEGGVNAYQNHLASITRIKPGFVRLWLLRAALFSVNLLNRFWFNQGELGGIPTILSARWVIIDNGKRLLFLDNYGGAWESYLNEFIDMPAVKGLNAIWSNTFVSRSGTSYRFPRARFLFWQGAQDEHPFKAYVRQSQVETIVWYGAYRTLSVVNVNSSTDLRQSLSKTLDYGKLDQVFQNL